MLKTLKMEPYLYINRRRQIRKYKSLKIFLDDIELLGNYVEIEYQDSKNVEVEIEEFKELFDIKGKEEKLYGDIFKDKIDKEKEFQKAYDSLVKNREFKQYAKTINSGYRINNHPTLP